MRSERSEGDGFLENKTGPREPCDRRRTFQDRLTNKALPNRRPLGNYCSIRVREEDWGRRETSILSQSFVGKEFFARRSVEIEIDGLVDKRR